MGDIGTDLDKTKFTDRVADIPEGDPLGQRMGPGHYEGKTLDDLFQPWICDVLGVVRDNAERVETTVVIEANEDGLSLGVVVKRPDGAVLKRLVPQRITKGVAIPADDLVASSYALAYLVAENAAKLVQAGGGLVALTKATRADLFRGVIDPTKESNPWKPGREPGGFAGVDLGDAATMFDIFAWVRDNTPYSLRERMLIRPDTILVGCEVTRRSDGVVVKTVDPAPIFGHVAGVSNPAAAVYELGRRMARNVVRLARQ